MLIFKLMKDVYKEQRKFYISKLKLNRGTEKQIKIKNYEFI